MKVNLRIVLIIPSQIIDYFHILIKVPSLESSINIIKVVLRKCLTSEKTVKPNLCPNNLLNYKCIS